MWTNQLKSFLRKWYLEKPWISPWILYWFSRITGSFLVTAKNRQNDTVACSKKQNFPTHAIKAYSGSRGITPLILNSALDGTEWLSSRPGHFTAEEKLPVTIEWEWELRSGHFWRRQTVVKIYWWRIWSYGDRRKGYWSCMDSVVELQRQINCRVKSSGIWRLVNW